MVLKDFIAQGGPIAWILVGLNIIGFALMFWKWWEIRRFNRVIQEGLPVQISKKLTTLRQEDKSVYLEAARTEIAMIFAPLEKGLTTIRNIGTTAPLMGLLGTVIGIFTSFEQVVEQGKTDPVVFAAGLKLAMVTTVIGLIVAIPHVIGYNYLVRMLDQEQDEVENEVVVHMGDSTK